MLLNPDVRAYALLLIKLTINRLAHLDKTVKLCYNVMFCLTAPFLGKIRQRGSLTMCFEEVKNDATLLAHCCYGFAHRCRAARDVSQVQGVPRHGAP